MHYALFDTILGHCGVSWSNAGLCTVQLPDRTRTVTEARLRMHGATPAVPPPWVREAGQRLARHIAGEPQDFGSLPLDLARVPPFHRKVYEAARSVTAGQTIGYGELAARAGSPGAARAVGQAMAKNPLAVIVPCHRVLASNGAGGFSAYGGLVTKEKLLAAEGRSLRSNGSDAQLSFDVAAAVQHLGNADRALAGIIERVGPCRLRIDPARSPFAALAEAIIHQQLTGKAAAAITRRLRERLGTHAFPTAAAVARATDAALRGAGLSRNKVLALRDLALHCQGGRVPPLARLRAMDDEAIVDRLTAVRGIGRWTVEMLLIFRMGRPDVLPVDDYGIRKGFARALRTRELPTPREVAARGERWRPYRTVASWYLWRAATLPDGRRKAAIRP